MRIYLFHPMLVHFTIALFSFTVFLDFLGLITKKESFHMASWYSLLASGVSVIFTVIAGLIAEDSAKIPANVQGMIELHEKIGFSILAIIIALAIWRIALKGKLPDKGRALFLTISVVGFLLICIGGYLGGELVYTHGVAVKAALP